MLNESAICRCYKKRNVNELKSELAKRGLAVQGKKEELFKRLIDTIQEDNSDKQLSISLIKEIFLNMFENLNKKTRQIVKKHKDNVTSIINDKISSINQKLDIINNLTAIDKVKSKTNDLTLSWKFSKYLGS